MTRVNRPPPWYVWLLVVANIAVSVVVNAQLTKRAVREANCDQATTWVDLYQETPPATPTGIKARERMLIKKDQNC